MPVQDICPPELGFGRCLTTGKLEAGSRARDQESPLLLSYRTRSAMKANREGGVLFLITRRLRLRTEICAMLPGMLPRGTTGVAEPMGARGARVADTLGPAM